ncbi:DapH/DapD/GlmU-related protein [Roseospira goensis]|uniref:UDP-3-O-[3-hydroxymyristoyl] glucosamine N-acyltransferase n=1 Tax=Roseospira goensis TaxID=391922 RepID=A0A7W6RWM4_9PROT|nr:DapH/DapD/GlmU-related protein [Roseospira goensis]MBB4284614.1 UDP-3-O-[3-hydroxymyristoyl] glucosamine N-acyltransferase [Roseospira goensis]
MTDIVLFGTGMVADVVAATIARAGRDRVVAHTVDRAVLTAPEHRGRPVWPFEEIETHVPPDRARMLVAVGYHDLNALRAARCADARAKGYELASHVGGAGADPTVTVGGNVVVLDGAGLQPYASVAEGTFVFSGATVGHHASVGPFCWVTSNSVISGASTIGARCFLGLGCVIGHRVTVGDGCVVGAGARLLKDAAPDGVYLEPGTDRFRLDTPRFLRMTRLA